MRQDVDTSILRDILHYDADTGILFWKQRPSKYFSDTPTRNKEGHAKWWNGRFAGKRACKSDGHRGYLRVSIFREEYPAHRVIWAMVHGAWPTKSIDHIDGDKANNRTSNLREATTAENNKNRAPHGKSQYRGVSWRTRQNCWVSAIKTDGKVSFLGCFKEEIEAAKAYDRAAIIQHGEFARTNFPKADYEARVLSALEPSVARELALEEAAHNLINELSGNPGELIDLMASKIRADGSDLCDGPWEGLSDDRKLAWRGDAERALAGVKEYLTTRSALSSPDHADAGKVEGDGWLPIESAPKDGTVIQAWPCNTENGVIVVKAYWYVHPSVQAWITDEIDCGDFDFSPTHWRPLPSAPAPECAE